MTDRPRSWAAPLARRPRIVLAVIAAVTIALGWQALGFRIDASPDTLLTPNNEHYVQTRVVNERFATAEMLVIAYQPRDHELLSDATFEDLRGLTREISALPRVASVRSLLNVPIPGDGNGTAALASLSGSSFEERELPFDELSRALRGHPIYEGLLVDEAQTITSLQVLFSADEALAALDARILEAERQALGGELSGTQKERLESLRRRAEPLQRALSNAREEEVTRIGDIVAVYRDDADVYVGGIHALEHGLIGIIEHDVAVFGSAIAVAICSMLLILFRSFRWMMVPVAACAISVTCTVGVFVLLGLETTVISANFVALQLILTLAVVMHLIVEYRQSAARHPEWPVGSLIDATMRRKTKPCLYAGLTTSVGFASLLVSGIQPVISFGWMMIIAMGISLAVTLILFPSAIALFQPGRPGATGGRLTTALLERLARLATRRKGFVLAASAAVFLWGLSGAFLLELENSFLDYFDESTDIHRDLAFIDRHLGGTTPLDVVYTIPEAERSPDLVLTAEAVQALQRIHNELEQHEAVGKVLSVTSFTALARRLNGDRPLTETELTAAYRLIPDEVRDELLGSFFAPDQHQVRFSTQIQDTTAGLDRSALLQDIRAGLESLGVAEDDYQLTNLAVLYEDILSQLFTSQASTIAVVLAALAAAFWASFGSLSVALTALVPNVLAATAVFGIMGWLGIELDVMTITIAAVTIGIAVDDTIHYVHRFLEVRRDEDGEQAVLTVHRTVGFPILYTTIIITLGFSLLALSDFVPSVLFGALTGFAMVVALIADLTLLPVLLARHDLPRERANVTGEVAA
jgi:hypothetical protein